MHYPDLPDIFDDVKVELEKYVLCPENLPIHKCERNQQFWPREAQTMELLHFQGAPVSTTLRVQRDLDTGKIIEFREVGIDSVGANASNSMSFSRAPAPPSETVRGSTSYVPFQPGSFPEPVLDLPKRNILLDTTELLTVPPGFERGLIFAEDGYTLLQGDDPTKSSLLLDEPKNTINLLALIEQEQDFLSEWETEKNTITIEEQKEDTQLLPEEEEVLPKEAKILNLSCLPPPSLLNASEWAVLLDPNLPVIDFEKKIPNMAKKFPFELDNFQKLAILQLEKHNHVFVAAHTSAGKTAVAEYAIALSQKHMTRTIYTSPIKALSNQKYRDFKDEFKDVGLITGDFQINQKASCLIMTTEILRSMLYCGSDITRDIEYVIFDEVHYINDRDRGHVWEQVLIMLPKEVCVVLLSATVPNTIEFADWLGRTHKRKVYVITTTKRPVPLHHFLYTGRWGGSRHNKFMVLEAERWQTEGYHKAKAALEPLKDQHTKFMLKQEKTLWNSLVDHLQKFELLPVVAFIFSRQRCDNNADMLSSLDLTSQQEKSQIVVFFNKCVRSLKEPDRNIPQIVKMKDILTRGIGVHHSGVLPIVKEIVEMLFQKGLIKILFATETFAMGVNMPTRTVIFDSIKKHDGLELRNLLPAEYIQMAGRAGRRGKDERGTVLILCKTYVPREAELREMMTGRPNKLVSQFRITYGMVLSLLRVESLTVEQMLSKSFGEADHPNHVADWESELRETEEQLQDLTKQQLSSYLKPLVQFFECASAYLNLRKEIMPDVINFPKVQKLLVPGAVLLINHQSHINKLALILSKKTSGYRVLILTDSDDSKGTDLEQKKVDLWYQMLALAQDKLFMPSGRLGHQVLTVSALDIFEITSKAVKVDTKLVEFDWEKRQQERFKYDPPGQTCAQAIQELQKLTLMANENQKKLEYQHFIEDLKVNEQSLYHSLKTMYDLRDKLIDHLPSTKIPNFEQQFSTVFERKFLEEKKKDLEFKLSGASLMLYPDYQNRITLLRNLGYVDSQNTVKLKGNIARAMGMNELLITELVVDDIFVDLTPAEVAALLSSLVFRVKLRGDQNSHEEELTPKLKDGIRVINQVHHKIANLELELGIQTEEFINDLNFGLVHVVFRWANAEPFVEIMKLTEIQEGIIVRCIQQLNETIMDVRDAAKIIGNPALQVKMEAASNAIKRDIVFAESLYTQDEKLV